MEMNRGILGRPRLAAFYLGLLGALLLLAGCPEVSKPDAELRQEVKSLKAEVAALKEKVSQLEAAQKTLTDLARKAEAARETLPPGEKAGEVLSVAQLLKDKDRYLGARVTVRGPVGTVVVHHKSLLLTSAEGTVEVYFGNLPDKKLVDRLTSTPLDQALTVTGVVSPPAAKTGPTLRLTAEAVEF